jgi:hypothetical protein
MTVGSRSRTAEIVRAAAPVAIIAVVAAVLLRFPPEQYSFYPQCPIYRYLHIRCPGCGTTRALAALLHGHLTEALRLNPLTTLLMPVLAIYAGLWYRRFLQHQSFRWPQLPSPAINALVAGAAIFTVIRNLNFG